ncbi:Dickkopf-related protein 1 [Bagarius yarrelli]|uniref:Dickkopf-related protein 1 n=1 Tax=Bagarius yarrelli TaxID=175774 RepID=A0A556TIJ4_BAGYA|nr:Dickkopf-related protein 1 [Bagarius yarrelli]
MKRHELQTGTKIAARNFSSPVALDGISAMMSLVAFSAWCLSFLTCAAASAVLHNSNAIKFGPAVVTASPDVLPIIVGEQNLAIDTAQPLVCTDDTECASEEFCLLSRGACLQCRKRRKRCIRDAMCCPGNHCSNGLCQANDPDLVLQAGVEKLVPISPPQQENVTVLQPSKSATQGGPQSAKGIEGDHCLRSLDCAEGLCCARHFWSKICKPVLKEGQVCTKHKRKGTHALEIFQRCDCGDGLSCRMQKGDHSKNSRSLHTCQRH